MFGKPKNNSGEDLAETPAIDSDDPQAEGARASNGNGGSNGQGGGGFLLDRSKPSVISEGFSLQGDITAQGVLHVEGFIKGTVQTDVVNIGPARHCISRAPSSAPPTATSCSSPARPALSAA